MTARFLKGTRMATLEEEMQQIPGFVPRKSGVIPKRYSVGNMKCADCQWAKKRQLMTSDDGDSRQNQLQLLTAELPEGVFVIKFQNCEAEQPLFKNEEHRRRFLLLLRCGLFPGLKTDRGFAAAVFLLSSDARLWEQAVPYVSQMGINYNEFHVRGVDLDCYAIFCAAKELGTGKPYLKLSELGDAELIHDGLLLLIIHGILISRHGIPMTDSEEEPKC